MADKSLGFNITALDNASKSFIKLGETVDRLQRKIEALDRAKADPEIDVDTAKADAKVGAFARSLQTRIERAVKSLPDIELGADASAVDRRIQEIRRQLAELSGKTIGVDVDAARAHEQIQRLSTELARLSGKSANIQVRADTAKAAADLAGVSSLARRVNGQRVAISVNAADVSRAISLLGLLTAGLAAVSAMGAPAVAVLGTVPALASAAGQGVGALAAGFSGVGDAVKALQAEDTKAAAGTAQSAASRVNSAQAIQSAQLGVTRAIQQADRAAVTGAQQVEDARQSLADAYEQGERRITAASQSLTRAQRTERDTQNALNRARADAIEQQQQLAFSVEEADIAQQRATLRLADAKKALAESTADPNSDEYKGLALDVRDADLATREAADRFADLKAQSAAAAKAGIDGADGVVAAQRQAADAAQGVRDAETDLAQARSDAAKQVADAQRGLERAQQQAQWAQLDAAAQVADAQRALANAYTDAGTAGATSANKVKEAMSGLSPEAQQFARFLSGEVIPQLHGIRDAVQATLLPRLETSMRNLGVLAPVVSTGLADTGRVLGDLAVKGSEMMSSGPWRRDFATIMDSNNRSLDMFGNAGLSTADALRSITVAAGPLVERFARFLERTTAVFDTFIQGKRATGELDVFFQQMSDTLAELGHITGQIITALIQITQAMGPLGGVLLQTVGYIAQLVGNLAQAHPLLTQVAGAALIALAAFNRIGSAVSGMVATLGVVTGGWRTLGGVLSGLAPSAVAARLVGVRQAMESASLAAGVATEKLTGSAAAGEKVAVAGSKVSGALTKVGSGLPLVGAALIAVDVATEALNSSFDEMAAGMAKGGLAAEQMRAELARNDAEMQTSKTLAGGYAHYLGFDWVRAHLAGAQTTDEFTKKLADQRAQMTAVQRATYDVGVAQGDYQLALDRTGPTSQQAAAAAGVLSQATQRQKDLQEQAADATKTYTDRINEQRDAMLGEMGTAIRYQDALAAVTTSVQQNGQATDITTEAGRRNKQALLDLTNAAFADIDAMGKQGAAQDDINARTAQYRDQLINAAIQIGMTRGEAQAYVDKLHLIPGNINTVVTADVGPATKAINDFIATQNQRGVMLDVGANITSYGTRAMGSVDFRPMATGGFRSMAGGLAAVVPPNTPTMIGDHPRVPEAYVPLDRRSNRSQQILSVANAAMGRTVLPMAAGGMLPGSTDGSMFGDLQKGAQDLTKVGLGPLADELTKTTVPALEALQGKASKDAPDAIRQLTAATSDGTAKMGVAWAGNARDVQASTDTMRRALAALQGGNAASWTDITGRIGASVTAITGPQFGGLHAGMDAVQNHSTNMANWVGGQWGRIRGLTGDPVRWSLDWPINRGLVPAWNAIDRFFALNRPMGPVPIGFSVGGTVPGGGSGDTVPTMLEPGEEVIRKDVAGPTRKFLKALNAGQAEAIQAAGGRFAHFALGGTVQKAQAFARAQHGKPYIWGGVGPAGYDCSGFQSAITNVALGEPPHHRRFSTASFANGPAGGFVNGLTSAYGIGVFQGNPGHVAGTLGGLNVEAGGSPSLVKAGIGAAGATNPEFRQHFSLPQVGGRFIAGSGGGFDVEGYLRREFAATRRLIGEITGRFGPGTPPMDMARTGTDAVAGASRSVTEFDRGGLWSSGLGINRSGRVERVLAPAETDAFHRLVDALTTKRGAAPLLVSALTGGSATPAVTSGPGRLDMVALGQLIGAEVQRAMSNMQGTLRIVDDGRNGLARIQQRQARSLARQG